MAKDNKVKDSEELIKAIAELEKEKEISADTLFEAIENSLEKVIAKMEAYGRNVRSKNYGAYRHEIHNESVKNEFFTDLIEFYDSNI